VTEPRRPARRLERFDDLAQVDDEVLRQLGARVHIMDLAYAFGAGEPALLERLLGAVRPGLAADIRTGVMAMQSERGRFRLDEQVRSSQAQVLELARAMLDEDGAPGAAGP
jgi:hypothetical protein